VTNIAGRLAWPYLLGLGLLVFIPAAAALALAFTDFTGIQAPTFSGADNLRRLGQDEAFWRSLANSAVYVVIAVPLRLAAAVAVGLVLHRRAVGTGAARAVAFAPSIVPDAAWALLWLWLLNPLYGPLAIALGGVDFLTDPWAARIAIPVMSAFQIGEAFVIALAARSAIPRSLYESATIDGGSPGFQLRRITLPLMAPVIAILALRDVIVALQVNFVPALIVTEGGPRYATTYLPLYIYRTAFRYFRFGYASALSVALFVITAAVIFTQYRLAKRWRLL
jgi:multiple sugar transport system permease protein